MYETDKTAEIFAADNHNITAHGVACIKYRSVETAHLQTARAPDTHTLPRTGALQLVHEHIVAYDVLYYTVLCLPRPPHQHANSDHQMLATTAREPTYSG